MVSAGSPPLDAPASPRRGAGFQPARASFFAAPLPDSASPWSPKCFLECLKPNAREFARCAGISPHPSAVPQFAATPRASHAIHPAAANFAIMPIAPSANLAHKMRSGDLRASQNQSGNYHIPGAFRAHSAPIPYRFTTHFLFRPSRLSQKRHFSRTSVI
jgi:hypothetical protein